MCRITCLVACCVLSSWAVWAEGYVNSINSVPRPELILTHPTANIVYVASSGSPPRLKFLDATTGTIKQPEISITDANSVRAMALDPINNHLYVANSSGFVSRFDALNPATAAVIIQNIPENNIYAMVVDPVNKFLYLSGSGDENLMRVNLDGLNPASPSITSFDIADNLFQLGVDSERNLVFATSDGISNVYVLTPQAGGTLNTVALTSSNARTLTVIPGRGALVGKANGSIDLIQTGGGPGFASNSTEVVDLDGVAINPVVALAVNPLAMPGNPVKVYAAINGLNSPVLQDRLYTFNLNGTSVTSTTNVAVTDPRSIAISSASGRAYVACNQSSMVFVKPDGTISKTDDNSVGTTIGTTIYNPATNRIFAIDQAATVPKIYVYDAGLFESVSAPSLNGIQTGAAVPNTIDGTFYAVQSAMMGGTNQIYQIKPDGSGVVTNNYGGTTGAAADIAINEITNKIYVSNPNGNVVSVFSGGMMFSNAREDVLINDTNLPTQLRGQQPSAMAVNSALNRIYVANKASNNVTVIFGGNNKVIASIPVGDSPEALLVDSNTNRLYVANKNSNSITIIDGEQNLLVATVDCGPNPQSLALGNGRLYVGSFSSSSVSIIDVNTNSLLGGISTGSADNLVAFNRANNRIYVVSRSSDGALTIANSSNNGILDVAESAGVSPIALVTDPVTNRAFVQQADGTLTVIDGAYPGETLQEFTSGGDARGFAYNPLTRKILITGNSTRLLDVESALVNDPPALTANGLLAGNRLSPNTAPAFTFTGDTGGSIYFQLDSVSGAWTRLAATGAAQTISLSNVSPGRHTLFVYKARNHEVTYTAQGSVTAGQVENNSAAIGKVEGFVFFVKPSTFPTLDAIPAQAVNEDQGLVEIEFFGATAGPLGTGNLTVTTSNANSNPAGLLGPITTTLNNDGTGRGKVSFTPTADLFGTISITVNVNDSFAPAGISTVSRTFLLTVRPVNDAPNFTVGANQTVSEASVITTVPNFISNIVLGPANETTGGGAQAIQEYQVTAAVPDQFKVQPAISTAGTLTFTPANASSSATPITIEVKLRDNGGTANGGVDLSTPRTFTITLTPVADSLIVLNTTDSSTANSNSLRDCMTRARSGDTITFDPDVFDLTNSNAATVINISGAGLPAMDDGSVTIDATDRRVTINGSGTVDASGILITSGNNIIRGLNIVGFPGPGLRIQGGAANAIGGSRTSGTGPNGQGLRLSGNGSFGIEIRGSAATGNTIKGCWIGLDTAGTSAEANLAGILIQDGAPNNTIGGTGSGEANVISGNKFEGTTFSGSGTDGNVFIGNQVGISAVTASTSALSRSVSSREDDVFTTRSAIGNGSAGMFLSKGTKSSTVGGDNDSEGNVVGNNGGNGVEVRATTSRKNAAKKNRISRNKSGGIKLFDNANDGISAPTFTSVTRLSSSGSLSRATSRVSISGTASSTSGSVEIFNDTGEQGGTFLTRSAVSNGMWTTEVDVSDLLNITATLTDDNGNTSAFAVFGRSPGDDSGNTDTDGDGISDAIETLAGTDPNSATSVPTDGGALSVDKLAISLNFAKTGKDSLKATMRVVLPEGFINTGATIAIRFADSSESATLSAKGASAKGNATVSGTGLVSIKLTGGSTLPASANTGARIVYAITKETLLTALQSAGLDNETTTDKAGESNAIPVAIAITSGTTVTTYSGSALILYKAKTGKSGKAKLSL